MSEILEIFEKTGKKAEIDSVISEIKKLDASKRRSSGRKI